MYMDKYKYARYNSFKWRYELNLLYKITLAIGFACLTGLLAQFRFYLPGSPVPITGQTFAVLIAGILLGKWGGISQGMYVGFGAMGVPWFAGMNAGLAYLLGPTGGYIIGFIFAAFKGGMTGLFPMIMRVFHGYAAYGILLSVIPAIKVGKIK